MSTLDVLDAKGKKSGSVELDEAMFGIEPNVPVMHQVVTAQLAARRSGSQSTKTRAEVSGGGAKPWRQKGTGRARQGSTRSPQWAGGGVALGPKPRSYAQRTPKKMIKLALRSALSDRAADGKVLVVDWAMDAPRTKDAVAALAALGAEGRVLVVLTVDDEAVWKSLRNLGNVHVCEARELNAYDVLVSDWVIFTEGTLPSAGPAPEKPAESEVAAPKAKKPPKAKAKATKAAEAPAGAGAETAPDGEAATEERSDKEDNVTAPAGAGAETAPDGEASTDERSDEGRSAHSHGPTEDGSAPAGFDVKGNADSMKYHVPGSQWYDATIAEVWFDTAEAAEAAGYVPAGGADAQDIEPEEQS